MKTKEPLARAKQSQAREKIVADWHDVVARLVEQIAKWAEAENWSVHRDRKTIHEERLGDYDLPTLRVRTNQGDEVHVNPVARYVMGRADGRVDLEGWPSLNRVRFIRRGGQWEIITDSNVPLRQPWNRKTFVQLARDLNVIS